MSNTLRLLVGLGWALRLFHYLRNPSVWHDEAALIVNVLSHDFGELLGPLLWHEAAPPLFLWLERAVVLGFGDSTFALRLVPLLSGCLALLLFADTAARRLPPRGAFWAVLLFAVSDRLLWHGAEAKPYALDVALASLALFAFTRTEGWPLPRRLLALILFSPLAIFASYPACFLFGGLWLAFLAEVRRSCSWRNVGLYLAWGTVFSAAFLILYFGPIRVQRTGPMEGCWTNHFPNWSRPWTLPWWSVMSTLEVQRYGLKPLGSALAGLTLVGGAAIWRRQPAWLFLLAAPLALAWLAAMAGGYPYGGSRLEIFALPGLTMMIGAGIDPVRECLLRRARYAYALGIVPLLLLPAVWAAYFVVVPWPRNDAAGAARFILAHKRAGEPIVANHWEFAYYFRHQPNYLVLDAGLPTSARFWAAATTQDDAERAAMIRDFERHGRILLRREFTYTTVILLERSDATLAQR